MRIQCNGMNKENFTIRLSLKRKNKLKLYAHQKDKTMTQIIEEMIDKLKLEKDTWE
jgi:predicted DNA-binding protein